MTEEQRLEIAELLEAAQVASNRARTETADISPAKGLGYNLGFTTAAATYVTLSNALLLKACEKMFDLLEEQADKERS